MIDITPVIVTRGNVPLGPILDSMGAVFSRETVIWDNGAERRLDIKVLGRYIGMFEAATNIVYVQDDDCIVSDPAAIFNAYEGQGTIACNMPQEFRHDGYTDSALVGFGAVMNRLDALSALGRFVLPYVGELDQEWFFRICDVPVTVLLQRTLVNVGHINLPWAAGSDRMYRQEDHVGERLRALELAREVRDA